MNWRLILSCIIVLGLAPGTWIRTPQTAPDFRDLLAFTSVPVPVSTIGTLDVLGVWEMDSTNTHFGSYSALISLDDGTLLAGSDRGRLLQFSPPGGGSHVIRFTGFAGAAEQHKYEVDLESLTRDPASGTIWAGYEFTNAIARVSPSLAEERRVTPFEMASWLSNSGPETMVRLVDGRFLVIAEADPDTAMGVGGNRIPALLFGSDPTERSAKPLRFTFDPPEGYRPVDAAQMPDGRVLVLVRKVVFGIPLGFATALILADPTEINVGEAWSGTIIARFEHPLPSDNFEGLAVTSQPGSGLILWMISDDNNAALQRTLLYKLGVPAGL